jgi:hypothetical protein
VVEARKPEPLPPISGSESGRKSASAKTPAKKGWWPFSKSKKTKPEKPAPMERKPAAPKRVELDPIPLADFEPEAVALPVTEEFVVPDDPQSTPADDEMPDFGFGGPDLDAPVKTGEDEEDFFQDLGLK